VPVYERANCAASLMLILIWTNTNLQIRVREGKGGRDGYAFLTDDCARYLRQYLSIRPSFKIDGRKPLFFTEYGNRWNRGGWSRVYGYYKVKAGIEKKGGLHVFGQHSAATLMTARGYPLISYRFFCNTRTSEAGSDMPMWTRLLRGDGIMGP
jgi:site-specific recombinase XerD